MRLIRGSEIWEIHHEGLVVRDGAASRRFVSGDHARTAFVKAIADRRALGFEEMPDAVIDLDARLVLADELQQHGDPRGELIAIQHALADPTLDAAHHTRLARRMRDVLEAHHDVLFGALAAFVRRPSRKTPDPAALEVTWTTGFAEEVRLQHAMGSALEDTYTALQRLPLARQIRKIVVGDPGAGPYGPTYRGLVNAMVASGTPPHLRSLVLGDVTAATRARIHAGDLRPLVAAMTELDDLEVGAGSGTLGPLVAPRLRRLAIAGLDPATVVSSTLPALRELDIRGAPAGTLLAGLPRSSTLANLTQLSIVRCGLGDIELSSLLLFADEFAHLEVIDLRGNHFTRELLLEVRQQLPRLKAGGR